MNRKILSPAAILIGGWLLIAATNLPTLPERQGPRPETTNGVPHIQMGIDVDPAIYRELLARVERIPNVDVRDTIISLPGAKGFWIDEEVALANPQAIVRGREFAHVHPDGSLHASLPVDLAKTAVSSGWAVLHPWANKRPGWEGFVMIYTPQSEQELNVVMKLIESSYAYVTGNT